jgi:hypothetical protein
MPSRLVTLCGIGITECIGILPFAQDDTSNKIKIKSKAL